jgi:hypothetical protein
MARWKLRRIDAATLLNLQEGGAGNLYWRGRPLTAAENGKVGLAVMLIGAACNLIRACLDLGRTAGWWH